MRTAIAAIAIASVSGAALAQSKPIPHAPIPTAWGPRCERGLRQYSASQIPFKPVTISPIALDSTEARADRWQATRLAMARAGATGYRMIAIPRAKYTAAERALTDSAPATAVYRPIAVYSASDTARAAAVCRAAQRP